MTELMRLIQAHIDRYGVTRATVARPAKRRSCPLWPPAGSFALPDLIAALRWTREPAELADALWVDQDTVRARMSNLDPIEVAQLENELDGQWIP
jgi:hypothetical protein